MADGIDYVANEKGGVEVSLWEQVIGYVELNPVSKYYRFFWNETFQKSELEPAPLLMPKIENGYEFCDLSETTFRRFPGMLNDSLPDQFGSRIMDCYFSRQGVPSGRISGLDRLAYLGRHAIGALTFTGELERDIRQDRSLDVASLLQQTSEALTRPVTERGCELLDDIIGIGSIAGGARPKVALAFHPERRVFRSALNSLPAGYESWLLKFDGLDAGGRMSASAEYGKIEYAYYLMSKNAGINMSLCDLFEEHGRSHFMTRRFDRDETGTRFHVQSLCAMSHLDYHNRASFSYGNYFETLKGLNLPYNDFEEAYRRMIFNVFSFNCDDHTKNFSFLLRQGGSWELAPCYDITFSYNPTGNKIKQHAISVNGRFREICLNDLYAEARRYGIESARHIIAEVGRAIDMWGDFAQTAGISPQKLDEIYSILSSAKKNNRWIG